MSIRPPTSDRRKLHGQNFLRPGPKVAALVNAANIRAPELVVEIGGGTGVLTSALLATGCRVIVIEQDREYAEALKRDHAGSSRATVVACDVRSFRWPDEDFRVFANIPFGLTTEILRLLLEEAPEGLRRADLIVQADVARKRAGSPTGNKLNLAWAPWWTMRAGAAIPAALFTPCPSVDASMLVIERRVTPLLPREEADLWRGLLRTGFERASEPTRRALRAILTSLQFRKLSQATGLDASIPVRRLSLDDWLAIYRVMRQHVPQDKWPRRRNGPDGSLKHDARPGRKPRAPRPR